MLKQRGFALFLRCKKETNELVNEVRDMTLSMKAEQEESFRQQDKKIKERVEQRLTEI